MKILEGLKHFLLSRESQRGQTLPAWIGGIILFFVLVGISIDGGFYVFNQIYGEVNAARACVAAAEAARRGGSAQLAYEQVLDQNGMSADRYSPQQGSGFGITKGIDNVGSSYIAAVSWDEPTRAFLFAVGIDSMSILGRVRCVGRDSGGLAPIAVRESAVQGSIDGDPPNEYTILGRDPKWDLADEESGTNFRGAVFLHMWCYPPNDPNCPDVRVFYPLTEEPPSAQTQKKLVEDCFQGINCSIWPDVAQRLPIVSGTSNKQLCKAFQDGGWEVGDKVVVIVFDGEVYKPDPTYGSWENVAIVGYAVYEITDFEPSDNNCNHVLARLAEDQIFTSLDDIPADVILLRSREIQVDYGGPIPWN